MYSDFWKQFEMWASGVVDTFPIVLESDYFKCDSLAFGEMSAPMKTVILKLLGLADLHPKSLIEFAPDGERVTIKIIQPLGNPNGIAENESLFAVASK